MASIAFPSLAKKATLSDGTTYGFVHVPAAPSKPTFLLLHGAPSSSYIWRHQIELLPKAGYGVIAPDLLGYGDTDRPESIEPYQFKYTAPHIHELVTKIVGLDKVVGVGHDFGSALLSHVYVRYRDLFTGLVFIAVGYALVQAKMDVDYLNSMATQVLGYPTSGYIRVFCSPEGVSLVEENDRLIDSLLHAKDPEAWKEHLCAEGGFLKYLRTGKELPIADWISPEELQMHNRILKGGYQGVFNWYKVVSFLEPAREDAELGDEGKKITVPTMFLSTAKDYAVMREAHVQMTSAAAENLRVVTLDTGHWAMLEAKDEVEKLLEDFAAGL